MSDKIKIYYLGAGHISIPVLERLMKSDIVELCGIGSQQKAAKVHNGAIRNAVSPLTKYCQEKGIGIELFQTVNSPEFHQILRDRQVDLLVVVSYGQILKPELLSIPPFGCLNVHASLLPKHRGAAPIVAAMVEGDEEAGISFMKMDAGLDTGPVYRVEKLQILPSDTAWSLEERLGVLAGETIGQCIYDVVKGGLLPEAQGTEGESYAKKIVKQDGQADWSKPAALLERMVRAFQPWPGVQAILPLKNGKTRPVKITEAAVVPNQSDSSHPGDIIAHGKEGILVACGKESLQIKRLIPEGKREMSAADYLLGSPLPQDNPAMVQFPKP